MNDPRVFEGAAIGSGRSTFGPPPSISLRPSGSQPPLSPIRLCSTSESPPADSFEHEPSADPTRNESAKDIRKAYREKLEREANRLAKTLENSRDGGRNAFGRFVLDRFSSHGTKAEALYAEAKAEIGQLRTTGGSKLTTGEAERIQGLIEQAVLELEAYDAQKENAAFVAGLAAAGAIGWAGRTGRIGAVGVEVAAALGDVACNAALRGRKYSFLEAFKDAAYGFGTAFAASAHRPKGS
jgi:hypothetical protein